MRHYVMLVGLSETGVTWATEPTYCKQKATYVLLYFHSSRSAHAEPTGVET